MESVSPGEVSGRALTERSAVPAPLSLAEKSGLIRELLKQKAAARPEYPLSSGQKALWFLYQANPRSPAYNQGFTCRLERVDADALRRSLQGLLTRHPSLRTVFVPRDGDVRAVVAAGQRLHLEEIEAGNLDGPALAEAVRRAYKTPFDLAQGPLLRAYLFRESATRHVLLLSIHHIVTDGLSLMNLLEELRVLYLGEVSGRPATLPATVSYAHFVDQEQQLLGSDKGKALWAYWQGVLGGELPVLALSPDKPRPAVASHNGSSVGLVLPPALTEGLRALSREAGVSLYVTLLSAFQVLLHKYTGQPDILVGSPAANRNGGDYGGVVGYFVNMVAMRAQVDGQAGFREMLATQREKVLGAIAHEAYPFSVLVEKRVPVRDPSRHPVFQAVFILQAAHSELAELFVPDAGGQVRWGDLTLRPYALAKEEDQFELTLELMDGKTGLSGSLKYNQDLFHRPTIERMAGHFRTLLESILAAPQAPIYTLSLLPDAERDQLLHAFNDTARPYPRDESIAALFTRQVARTPHAEALRCGAERFTYAQLNERANQLAHLLRDRHGVGPGALVGVLLPRSPALLIGILSILKAGGAYLPLDPADPLERLAYLLADAAPRAVLLENDAAGQKLPFPAGGRIALDGCAGELARYPVADPAPANGPGDLAYVMYTSGTTGRPKGVMVSQRNVARLVLSTNYLPLDGTHRLLQTGALCFDATTFEFWGMLLNGGALHLVGQEDLLDPVRLKRAIVDGPITTMWLTSSWFNQLVDADVTLFEPLRYLLVGGDKLSPYHVGRLRTACPHIGLINGYGPTENTTFSLCHAIGSTDGGPVPIGKPIANSTVYILDASRQLVPVGVVGELYLGGDGLSQGYLHREDLTAQQFVAHPFEAGSRLYRSGDLGRWRADGTVEFVGRADNQVKINGYRIETEELESILAGCAGICQAVVAVVTPHAEKALAAYYTSSPRVSAAALRAYLQTRLPAYMVPAYLVPLEQFPLTGNGKVDRTALPAPVDAAGEAGYEAPATEREAQLLRIWEEVLGRRGIGMGDNFFERGGHSLKATQLAWRIRRDLGAEIALSQLFTHPTPRALAGLLPGAGPADLAAIPPVAAGPHYPVSHAQKRLWLLDQLEAERIAYVVPGALRIRGPLDRAAFERAIEALVARHESLRTTFVVVDGEPRQRVHAPAVPGIKPVYADLRETTDPEAEAARRAGAETTAPFDLENGPLVRVKLLQLAGEVHLVLLTLHHIASDGWSLDVLLRELAALYNAYCAGKADPLATLAIQYKDFTAWQHGQSDGPLFRDHRAYWLGQLGGEVPVLDLPADFKRPPVKTYRGATLSHPFGPEVVAALRTVGRQHGASLFMTLLAAVKALLYRYTGQSDLVIGSPVAGRQHEQLENQVGFYVNTLALRTAFDGHAGFGALLDRVKSTVLAAFAHQAYPFDQLVQDLGVDPDRSRSPLFDVMVVFAEKPAGVPADGLHGLATETCPVEQPVSKFDLTFGFGQTPDGLLLRLEYNSDLFRPDRVARMLAHFGKLLTAATGDVHRPLGQLAYLEEAETQKLLLGFNQTAVPFPDGQTMHGLFEAQAARTPGALAVAAEGESLTYAQLNEKANQLAHCLRGAHGVKPGDLVGLMTGRSTALLVGLLGILKSGAAYLPVDPEYPRDRIRYILGDAAVRVIVTDPAGRLEDLALPAGTTVLNAADGEETGPYGTENPPAINAAGDLAYVIYTSGSTGKPKGVMIEHRSNVNMALDQVRRFALTPQDRVLQFSSLSFDASVYEITLALYAGATLVLVDKETINDPARFVAYLRAQRVSFVTLPPVYLGTLDLPALSFLRVIVTAGEAAQVGHAVQCSRQGDYYNAYGPTECAVCVAVYQAGPGDAARQRVPIGRPLANTQIYLLDAGEGLVPEGVAGEICVGGAGLARGYLNGEALTREKFIDNPFAPGTRLYRTGDLGRWLPDGNLEFLGRKDAQIKIRGYRIELGEIENTLLAHPAVGEALVVAAGPAGSEQLTAYVTAPAAPAPGALRTFLGERLPAYMIPAHFVTLDAFPLTPHGKIDRKALPPPADAADRNDTPGAAPGTEAEKVLVAIFESVTGRTNLGVDADFFQVGGDSIKAIQITARLHSAGYKATVRDIFQHPVIARLAACLTPLNGVRDQAAVTGRVPLTPIQREFFAEARVAPGHYNQAVMLHASAGFDEAAVRDAFAHLLTHHDALRTVFRRDADGQPVQLVPGPDQPASLRVYHLEEVADPLGTLAAGAERLQAGIDLEEGPLVKLALFHLPDGDRLLIVIHHLVIDGVSWRILVEDLNALLARAGGPAPGLPPKTDSFRRWAESLEGYAHSPALLAEQTYWEALEHAAPPALPRDYPAGANLVQDAATLCFQLTEGETDLLLHGANGAFGTEINDLLLAALGLGIGQTYGLEKVLVALEGHGREEITEGVDVSRTVGWFTSVYPVCLEVAAPDDLSRTVKEVKEQLRRIPRKGIGYGILKHLAGPAHGGPRLGRQPSVCFNYLGQFDADLAGAAFTWAREATGPAQHPAQPRPYDLDVTGLVREKRLSVTIAYGKNQYRPERVEKLLAHYRDALRRIIAHCAARPGRELTPGDLTYQALTVSQLDALTRQYALEDLCPLSPMQEGMLFHALLNAGSPAYCEQLSFEWEGPQDIAAMEASLRAVVARHQVLRTVFLHEHTNRPLQAVLRERPVDFHFEDLSDQGSYAAQLAHVEAYREKDRRRSFRLDRDVLLRLAVFRLSGEKHVLAWSFHHIILDGWCLGILFAEFFAHYRGYRQRTAPQLLPVTPYSTYLRWLERQDKNASVRYWSGYLEGYAQTAGVPSGKPSATPAAYQDGLHAFGLGRPVTEGLHRLAARNGVTLNAVLQTLWGILVSRYNNTRDVVFGAVVSGRPPQVPGVEHMVGLFINTIPVRVRYAESTRFTDLLGQVQAAAAEGEAHHYLPLADIQALSPLREQLLEHILVVENYPLDARLLEPISGLTAFEQTNYAFNVVIAPGDSLTVKFRYDQNVHEPAFVATIGEHLLALIDQVLAAEDGYVHALTLLSPGAQQRLCAGYGSPETWYPGDKTLQALFEEQAARTPEAVAVWHEGRALTYRGLNEKANQLAHYLRETCGVGPGDLVALLARPSDWLPVAALGIVKAGAAYIPLDPAYPQERLGYVLADAAAKVLLATDRDAPAGKVLPPAGALVLPEAWVRIGAGPAHNPDHANTPADLAYVIYTSGSTGQPKGVMIEHRSLVNLCYWHRSAFGLNERSRASLYASAGFDASVWETWPYLLSGGSLHPVPGAIRPDPAALVAFLAERAITHCFLPTLLCEQLQEHDTAGTHPELLVLTGGDALKKAGGPIPNLVNNYGPTEATVVATSCRLDGGPYPGGIPIGKPVANTSVYLVDDALRLQPPGVTGEIAIAGDGLARGYLNRPDLTAQKFVENPFRPGTKLYLTGDLGRWGADGTLSFLGRKDNQVKLRGNRIEPGEIEHVLRRHAAIADAVVTLHGHGEEAELAAYLICREALPEAEVRRYLNAHLPGYMVPAYLCPLDAFPLNASGKVNRRALPPPREAAASRTACVPPATATERQLAAIWEEVLDRRDIGTTDNFFEIGGHSLKATRVMARIAGALHVRLDLRHLFTHPTLGELAAFIAREAPTAGEEIVPVPVQAHYEVSHEQRRLWISDQYQIAYNIPGAYVLEGNLDRDAFARAFDTLLARHEILRTTFTTVAAQPRQVVREAAACGFALQCLDLTGDPDREVRARQLADKEVSAPFDLEAGPLLRVRLVRLESTRYLFLLTTHHIIADGWSTEVLMREVTLLYNAYRAGRPNPLPPLRIQYKDYAAWQQGQRGRMEAHRQYWLGKFATPAPILKLPTTYPRPAVKTYNGDKYVFGFDPALHAALKALSGQYEASLFMTLLALLKALLYRYTLQEDLVIGSVLSGRTHQDLEGQIGYYLNTLPFRTVVAGSDSFGRVLEKVKETTLGVYQHQQYPFHQLVEDLRIPRDPGRAALFDVMFSLQNQALSSGRLEGLTVTPFDTAVTVAKYDLTVVCTDTPAGLLTYVEYNCDLFDGAFIRAFADRFTALARQMAAHPERPINEAELAGNDPAGVAESPALADAFDFDF